MMFLPKLPEAFALPEGDYACYDGKDTKDSVHCNFVVVRRVSSGSGR